MLRYAMSMSSHWFVSTYHLRELEWHGLLQTMVEKGGASGRFVTEQEVSLKCVLAPINKLVNHRLDIIYDFRSEEVLLEYVQEWISFSKSRRLPSAVYSANVHVWKKDACETSRFADWNQKRRVNCFIKPDACPEERRLRDFLICRLESQSREQGS